MVQDGMRMTCPDGEEATIRGAGEARWHIEKDNGVIIWGSSTAEVQQLITQHDLAAERDARLALGLVHAARRAQELAAEREQAKLDKQAAKESAAALRKALNRKAKCITGTDIEKWQGVEVQYMDVVAWAAIHFTAITCTAPPDQFDALAANLQHANGQQFTPLMDGFRELGEKAWGIAFRIYLDTDLPEHYRDEVMELQQRCGCRKDEDLTTNKRSIFCKEIAISLLQLGYKLGGRT